MCSVTTVHSSVIVDGYMEGVPTPMLVDTGSALTLIREDIWKATTTNQSKLQKSDRTLITADGGSLEILGQTTSRITIGGTVCTTPITVTRGLSQPCKYAGC